MNMNFSSRTARWWIVVIFAIAMAWVEAAVVYYLRSMIHRIAVTDATTNAHAVRGRTAQLGEIGFRGGDYGKHAV